MSTFSRISLLLVVAASLSGCGETRVQVRVLFPSETDRTASVSVHIWILDATTARADCASLMDGTSDPYGPDMVRVEDLVFVLADLDDVTPSLRNRRYVFYAQAVGFSGAPHLQGCEEVELDPDVEEVQIVLGPLVVIVECSGAPDGSPCDDELACTVNDECIGSTCTGVPLDCSALSGPCITGNCDEAAGGCVLTPLADATLCTPEDYCEVGGSCTAGVCVGTPRDCSPMAGQCETASCNSVMEMCVVTVVANGVPCNDSLFCTQNEICVTGACTGGTPRDCSGMSNQCNIGTCDEVANACIAAPELDGTACSDGQFCTEMDTCMTGACTGGPARDCSALANQCNIGACDEVGDTCFAMPVMDGTACNDGMSCTSMDVCTGGVCMGTPGTEGPMGDPTCSDMADNDCDMFTDAADPGCM